MSNEYPAEIFKGCVINFKQEDQQLQKQIA